MTINEQELQHIKSELKEHSQRIHALELGSSGLRSDYANMHKTLDEIESQIKEIAKTVLDVQIKVSTHSGASEMKSKIFNTAYMFATLIIALIANDYVVRKIFES